MCQVDIRDDLHRFSETHNQYLKIRYIRLVTKDRHCFLSVVLPNQEQLDIYLVPGTETYNQSTPSAETTLLTGGRTMSLVVTNTNTSSDIRPGRFRIGGLTVFGIATPPARPPPPTPVTDNSCSEERREGNVAPSSSLIVCMDYNKLKQGQEVLRVDPSTNMQVSRRSDNLLHYIEEHTMHNTRRDVNVHCQINKNAYRLEYWLFFEPKCPE